MGCFPGAFQEVLTHELPGWGKADHSPQEKLADKGDGQEGEKPEDRTWSQDPTFLKALRPQKPPLCSYPQCLLFGVCDKTYIT